MLNRAIGSTLLVLLLVGCAQGNPPELVRSTRPDLGPTYRLTDGKYEVHVSPEIGRVMHFSRVGEPNILWTYPGAEPAKIGTFINFGGDKLWSWPQNDGGWGWPPPTLIDRGPFEQKPADPTRPQPHMILQGPVDPDTGLQAHRLTAITADGRVENTYTLARVAKPTSTKPLPKVAAWSIAQVPAVQDVYVRLMPNPPAVPTTQMGTQVIKSEPVGVRWLKVTPVFTGAKLGLAGDAIAVRVGNRVILIHRTEDNDSPDLEKQVAAQLYFTEGDKGVPTPQSYIEMELIGPTVELAIGQSASLKTEWKILTPAEFEKLLKE
jgi:hypothetical protein